MYDVDSLGVIFRSKTEDVFGKGNDFNLGALLDKALGTSILSKSPALNLQPQQIIGYDTQFKPLVVLGKPLEILIEQAIEKIRDRVKEAFLAKDFKTVEELIGMDSSYEKSVEYKLIKVYQEIQKNKIVDDFISILTDPSSKPAMELPISMERFKKKSSEGTEEGMLDIVARMIDPEKTRDEVLYPKIDLSHPLHQLTVHRNSTSGLIIRGAGSNAVKIFAYTKLGAKIKHYLDSEGNVILPKEAELLKNNDYEAYTKLTKVREQVRLKKSIKVKFNGATYNTLSDVELKKNENGALVPNEVVVKIDENGNEIKKVYSIWDTLDSLINAAIDNVKEQIIALINLTTETSNEYFAGIFLGIPLDTMIRFMNSPVLFQLSFTGTLKKEEKWNTIDMALIKKLAVKRGVDTILSLRKGSATRNELEDYLETVELTDANMESSAIV